MSEGSSDFKRVLSASGVYALAALVERGLAFVLLPVYTRFIDPVDYGVLELLTALSTVVFGFLAMGLPSAIMKCYHRDCDTPRERAGLLATALLLGLPPLLTGGAVFWALAPEVSRWITGAESQPELVRLVAATGVLASLTALILANLRAQERALAFSVLTVVQFAAAMSLNIVLVVHYQMGVRGVLWGNLLSNVVALPLAIAVGHRVATRAFLPKLVTPVLRFGLLLIPVTLAGWIINMSDRYVLRLFSNLSDVAVYGVGYKIGMIVELAVVWPFQLAWPAVSFSISRRENHRETYARILTYLSALLVFVALGVALLSRVALPALVGEGYRGAYRVVPLVALAYAFNGIQYCVAPGVHISERTRYLTLIVVAGAVLNLGLNFLLIPRWGMMGAAVATTLAFGFIAFSTGATAQRFYSVSYEYRRLGKIAVCGAAVFLVGIQVPPAPSLLSVAWHTLLGVAAFPLALALLGFLNDEERLALQRLWRRTVSRVGGASRF